MILGITASLVMKGSCRTRVAAGMNGNKVGNTQGWKKEEMKKIVWNFIISEVGQEKFRLLHKMQDSKLIPQLYFCDSRV